MVAKMARGTFLLMIAVMVIAWAMSLNRSDARKDDLFSEPWSIYC
jgi:hypothetical protein